MKLNGQFVQCQLFFETDPSQAYSIRSHQSGLKRRGKQHILIKCQTLKSKGNWKSILKIDFYDFLNWFLVKKNFRDKRFLINLNFFKSERALIVENLKQFMCTEKNELNLKFFQQNKKYSSQGVKESKLEKLKDSYKNNSIYTLNSIILQDKRLKLEENQKYEEKRLLYKAKKQKIRENQKAVKEQNSLLFHAPSVQSTEAVTIISEQNHQIQWQQSHISLQTINTLQIKPMEHYQELNQPFDEQTIYKTAQNESQIKRTAIYKFQVLKDKWKISIYNPLSRNPNLLFSQGKENDEKIKNILLQSSVYDRLINNNIIEWYLMNWILQNPVDWVGKKAIIKPFFVDIAQSEMTIEQQHLKSLHQINLYKRLCTFFSQFNPLSEQLKQPKELFYCIQELKYMLIYVDFNNLLRSQNEFLTNNFTRKEYFLVDQIQSSKQKIQLRVNVYRSQLMSPVKNLVFCRFDISIINTSKTKFYKFIIDQSDIKNLFDQDFSWENCFDNIVKVTHKFVCSLIYFRRFLYKNFYISIQKLYHNNNLIYHLDMGNLFNLPNQFFISQRQNQFLTKKSFLNPVYKGVKYVIQQPRKLLGHFALVTVQYIYQLNFFIIQFYFPINCRKYSCYLYSSDLIAFTPEHQNQIISYQVFQEVIKNDVIQKLAFREFYEQFKNIQKGTDQSNAYTNDTKSLFVSAIDYLSQNQNQNYLEFVIWERIIQQIEIIQDRNLCNYYVKMFNFEGIIRELLVQNISGIKHNQHLLTEVFFEEKHFLVKEMFSNIRAIRILDSQYYNCYVRLSFFETNNTTSEKIFLEQLLNDYFNDPNQLLQNIYQAKNKAHIYEFNQADLNRVGVYLVNQIRKNYVDCVKQLQFIQTKMQVDLEKLKQKQFIQKEDKTCQTLKTNSDINIRAILAEQEKSILLIYRKVFTLNPLSIAYVFVQKEQRKFIFVVQNCGSKILRKITIKYSQVALKIPYFEKLIVQNLYQEIGCRLFLSFKNKILVNIYTNHFQQ